MFPTPSSTRNPEWHGQLAWRCWHVGSTLLGVWLCAMVSAQELLTLPDDPVRVAEQQDARRQSLEAERLALLREQEEDVRLGQDTARRLSTLRVEDVTESAVDQARVDLETAQVRLEELQAQRSAGERRLGELKAAIADLQGQEQLLQNPARELEDPTRRFELLEAVRQTLELRRVDLELEQQNQGNLTQRLGLLQHRLAILEQWRSRVDELYRQKQTQGRRDAQETLTVRLEGQRQDLLGEAAVLSRRLREADESLSEVQRRRLRAEIASLEEQAEEARTQLRLATIDNALVGLEALLQTESTEAAALREGLRHARNLGAELRTIAELLERKRALYRQRRELVEETPTLGGEERRLKAEELRLLGAVLSGLEELAREVRGQLGRAELIGEQLDAGHRQALSRELLARKPLPVTLAGWRGILTDLADAPSVLFYQVRLSLKSTAETMAETGALRWSGLVLLETVLLLVLIALWRGLAWMRQRFTLGEDQRFSGRMAYVFLRLLSWNLPALGVAVALLAAIYVLGVPQPGRGVLITLILLWIGVKLPVDLAWLLLASPQLPAERRRPRLYRQWLWTLMAGGILAAVTALAHLSGLATNLVHLMDWLFMVFLLLIIPPVLRARRFFIDSLARRYAGHRWFAGLRLTSFLLPLALLAIGLAGLAGYLALAWTIGWYLLVFLVVIAAWLILQGLLNDLAGFLKTYANRRDGEELLWPGEIIDPVHKILNILLFLGACIFVFRVYGWDEEYTVTAAWQVLVLTVALVLAVYEGVYFIAGSIVRRSDSVFGCSLIRNSRQPLGAILPLLAAQLLTPYLDIPEAALAVLRHALVLAQIVAVSWLVIRLTRVLDDMADHRYQTPGQDRLTARRAHTQVRLLRQMIILAVYLVAIGAMLMTFPTIRQLGAGLLASAGVAGLVLGIAARPFLANLIAGIQIGLTQPIRLDDEVMVEGEWGRIAEINPTHVIIQIWDDRRLVVPLNYFNEKPFENWTRSSTHLIGSVFLRVDYPFPVEEGRKALKEILDGTDLWDGRVWVLQVTNAGEQNLELRALMSAKDAPTAWDLRCHVREKLVEFLQHNYPEMLPRSRVRLERQAAT